MEVTRIADGLWRWTGLHPDWKPASGGPSGWEQAVGSYYLEAPDAIVLFDPLVPPEDAERFWTALDRDVERAGVPVHVLLTVSWHARSSRAVAERYGAEIWAHERGREVEPTRAFAFGDALPGGVEARDASRLDETVYWIPAHGSLVFGDVVMGAPDGRVRLAPDGWLPDGVGRAELTETLRELLELPVERLLVTHGEPVPAGGRDELARALA